MGQKIFHVEDTTVKRSHDDVLSIPIRPFLRRFVVLAAAIYFGSYGKDGVFMHKGTVDYS